MITRFKIHPAFLLFLFSLTSSLLPAQFGPFISRGIGGGGAIYAPSFNPLNSQEIYINCDMNELFRTSNAGNSWDILDFRQFIPVVESPVQFTSNTNRRYALRKKFIQNFTDIFSTTDGGQSWFTRPNPAGVQGYFMLYANPQNDSVFFVNSANKIYMSRNRGLSYDSIYTSAISGDCHLAGAFFDGPNYFVCTNMGLLTSTNSGTSFQPLFSTGIPTGTEEIFSFSGGKTGSGIRFLCATLNAGLVNPGARPSLGTSNGFKTIYGNTYGQLSWTSLNAGLEFPQYDKISLVSMATNDTANMYAAGTAKIGTATAGTVYKSTNGGLSWKNTFIKSDIVNPLDSTNAVNNNFISPAWFGYTNTDNNTNWWTTAAYTTGFSVDPANSSRMLIMNNSACHLSTDGGSTWKQLYSDPASTNPSGQTIQANDSYLGNGFEDTGSWWLEWISAQQVWGGYNDILAIRSTDGGAQWSYNYSGLKRPTNPSGGTNKDVGQFLMHPGNGKIYAAAGTTPGQGGLYIDPYTDPRIGSVMFSGDSGATWNTLKNFQHCVWWICIDPANTNRMYAAVANTNGAGYPGAIYICDDISQGASSVWDTLAIPPGTAGRPNFIQVLTDGTFLAGYGARDAGGQTFSTTSGVFYSTNNGTSWLPRSVTGMNYSLRSITVDPNYASDSVWWACVHAVNNGSAQAGLWKTTDRGQTWTRPGSNGFNATTVTFDPLHPHTAWMGTEGAGLIYITNTNLTTPVFDTIDEFPFRFPWKVFFNPFDAGELWVTTFGNGLRLLKCALANGGTDSLAHACSADAPQDLSLLIGNHDTGGIWTNLNAAGGFSGSILNPSIPASGTYAFSYKVGTGRCVDSALVSITIDATPAVTFTGLQSVYCSADSADTLIGNPSGGIFSGDNQGNTPSFVPNAAPVGNDTVFYTVISAQGCVVTDTQFTQVFQNPAGAFTFLSNNLTVTFTDQSNAATQWLWYFGDGNNSSQQNPNHSYATGGAYIVCLVAINGSCRDSVCDTVNVIQSARMVQFADSEIELFPNPGRQYLNILCTSCKPSESPVMIDLNGKIVSVPIVQLGQGKRLIHTQSVSSGLYLIRIRDFSKTWMKE